jgi:hypothetical protein
MGPSARSLALPSGLNPFTALLLLLLLLLLLQRPELLVLQLHQSMEARAWILGKLFPCKTHIDKDHRDVVQSKLVQLQAQTLPSLCRAI